MVVPISELAVDFHVATRLLDEAVDLGQAQAGTMTNFLGGEERIECPGFDVFRHACARVGHCEHDVLARYDLDLRGGILVVEMHVRCLDRKLAAARHGVPGIDRKIENREFKLVGIGKRAPDAAAQHRLHGHLLAERAPQKVRHARDEAANIDGLGIERLLAREGQKPLRQRFRAARALHDVSGKTTQPCDIDGIAVERPGHRFDIADDDRQQIVEIVRDAAGELPNALHLLRLARALVGGASFRQIPGDLCKAQEFALVVLDGIDEDARPEPGSVLAHPPVFGFELSGLPGGRQRFHRHIVRLVLGRIKFAEVPAENFCARIAFDAFGAGVPIDHVAGGIKHIDRIIAYAFDEKAKSPFRFLKFAEARRKLSRPFLRALFQGLIERLQVALGLHGALRSHAGWSDGGGHCRSRRRPAPPVPLRSARRDW